MLRRPISLLAALILVLAACSSDEPATESTSTAAPSTTRATDESTTTTEPPLDPLARTVTIGALDPATNEPIETELTVGPTTYSELLAAGIDAGLWDELGGLELLLGHAVGAVPSSEVPGSGFLLTREFTDLLDRAHELSLSDEYTADDLASIRRWYELAVPGPDVMDMLEATSTNVSLKSLRSHAAAQTGDCAPIDPADFSGWGVIEGCYRMWAQSVEGVTVRVFYPAWYEDDPTNAGLPLAAGQALVAAIGTYARFAPVGDIDAVFSLVDTAESDETLAVADHDSTWGVATRGGACPVTLFPLGFNDEFENTLAHEAWHCVQREMGFPRGVDAGTAWFIEAGAQYFANVVFPETAWFSTFDWRSTEVALFDMSYEAWVWWQFLASRDGNGAVAQLHKEMVDAGDGGQGAMVGRAEQFQRFVIELVGGKISGPVELPRAQSTNVPGRVVTKNSAGTDLEFTTGGFVAARYGIRYDKELRVFESDASPGDVNMAMAEWASRVDPDSWKEVFPEVRSKCTERVWYIVAVTTETPQSGITSKITIDTVEEASCDPCVLGTWQLDNSSFEEMLKSQMGGAIPAGSDFSIGGNYYIAFDDEGKVQEQRDGFTITVASGGYSIDMAIDSFATGNYTADGERLGMSDLVELFSEVDMGGFGGGTFDTTDSRALGGDGTYVCTTDDLQVTIPEGTVRWVRVDKILEPPPIEGG